MLFRSLPLLVLLAASPGVYASEVDPRADDPGAADPDAVEPAPLSWGATDATYRITIPPEGPLRVELEWVFSAVAPAWMDVPLAGSALVVDTVTGPATATAYGLRALLSPRLLQNGRSSRATIAVTGTIDPSRPGAASLAVYPAARQRVIIDAPGLDVTVAGATDGWLAASDRLALTWKPHVAAVPTTLAPLVTAEASTAVWAEPGALLTRAAVRWRVVRGEVSRFELDVTGLEEVEVEGPNLARAVREGDRMVLTPRAPVRGTFAVDVRARRALTADVVTSGAELSAPAPRPIAARVERYWTVGRAEDGELVPIGGPRAVPARTLPEWARGLSDTPPESFWQGDAPLRLRLARFSPMMGPDTVIERAELVVATAAEGRALIRTTWHTRNERRQYLHVRPPPGLRPMTARVSGEPVTVLSDGAGGVYVPLEKSVETLQGLLTFPVELTWIAEGDAWDRKGERTLLLPSVDAPIQAADWEVYLPRGWTAPGQSSVATAAPPPVVTEADEALQQAVIAYKSNDFASSQGFLEVARASGSTSANVGRLQSNLDVLLGKDGNGEKANDEGVEDGASRRVRELANAKTVTMQVEQEKAVDKARWAYNSGDIEEAERYLEEVIAYADDIGMTEQKESAEQSGKKEEATKLLSEVVAMKKRKSASASSSSSPGASSSPPEGGEVTTKMPVVGGFAASAPPPDAPKPVITSTTTSTPAPATGENAYVIDGLDIAEEEPAPPAPPEPVQQFDREFLQQVPASRSYQSVVQAVPGVTVTAAKSSAARGGKGQRQEAVSDRKDGKSARPAKPAPARDIDQDSLADEQDGEDEYDKDLRADVPDQAPEQDSPAPPEERAALDVKAAPLTLAMPLGGEVIRSTAALLPANAHPTLTLPYRTTSRDIAVRKTAPGAAR
ncbi:MAG: hypothetical protein V4850_29230 [Myxococcota bacterium]